MSKRLSIFWTSVGIQLAFVLKSWITLDSAFMLKVGLELGDGKIRGFSKLVDGAGTNIGSLLQILTGLPLMLFPHYQSPLLLVIIFYVLSYFLIISVLREVYDEKWLLLYTILFCLSPLRYFNTGFLWEPSFVYFPAALHFWAIWQMATAQSARSSSKASRLWVPSFALAFSLLIGIQIHNSVVVLYILTLLLFLRKRISINWFGIFAGAAVGALTLIPTTIELLASEPLQFDKIRNSGYIGKGFVKVVPVLKGAFYWIKMGGFDLIKRLKECSLPQVLSVSLMVCAVLSVIFSAFSAWVYGRKKINISTKPSKETTLRGIILMAFISLIIASGLSSGMLQSWQVLVVHHLALIPVLYGFGFLYEKHQRETQINVLYVGLQLAVILALLFSAPRFNRDSNYPDHFSEETQRLLNPIIPEYVE